jgi:hypothetical protein
MQRFKDFYKNWELFEVVTGYLPLGHCVLDDWANT